MNRMFRYVTVILIFISSRAHGQELSSISVRSPIRKYGSVKLFQKTTGYPKILNTGRPANAMQSNPYFMNPSSNCHNLNQYTAGKIKSCVKKHTQPLESVQEAFTDFGGLAETQNPFELDKYKSEGYTGDKEIHILHLPKNKPYDFDDIKLHLSLLNAHSTPDVPEIDLDFNKHFGNFEVNLASIQPPKLDASFLPTPTTFGATHRGRPSIQYHLDSQFPLNVGQRHHDGSEDILEIPHIEKHPLEDDSSKSSYNTPGAVNSYGDPIWPSAPSPLNSDSSFHPKTSVDANFAQYAPQYSEDTNPSYNSPNAVDSYGNLVNNPGQFGFNENNFFKADDYFNQLNIINSSHRRRRQEAKRSSEESGKASAGHLQMERETRHRNHKYK